MSFSRRDFLKVAGVGLGTLAFKPFNLESLGKPNPPVFPDWTDLARQKNQLGQKELLLSQKPSSGPNLTLAALETIATHVVTQSHLADATVIAANILTACGGSQPESAASNPPISSSEWQALPHTDRFKTVIAGNLPEHWLDQTQTNTELAYQIGFEALEIVRLGFCDQFGCQPETMPEARITTTHDEFITALTTEFNISSVGAEALAQKTSSLYRTIYDLNTVTQDKKIMIIRLDDEIKDYFTGSNTRNFNTVFNFAIATMNQVIHEFSHGQVPFFAFTPEQVSTITLLLQQTYIQQINDQGLQIFDTTLQSGAAILTSLTEPSTNAQFNQFIFNLLEEARNALQIQEITKPYFIGSNGYAAEYHRLFQGPVYYDFALKFKTILTAWNIDFVDWSRANRTLPYNGLIQWYQTKATAAGQLIEPIQIMQILANLDNELQAYLSL